VDSSPFHFAGFNNYYMPTYAADPNLNERIQDVDVVFEYGLFVVKSVLVYVLMDGDLAD